MDSPEVNSLLLHHVPYSTIPATSPTQLPAFLGVKFKVTVQQVQESLITWSRHKGKGMLLFVWLLTQKTWLSVGPGINDGRE